MVTNCSKERPGSIVTKTLKMEFQYQWLHQRNHILMLILNIQVSSRSVIPIKSYEPEKICLILENRGKHPVKFSVLLLRIWKGLFLFNAPLFTLKVFAVLRGRVKRKIQNLFKSINEIFVVALDVHYFLYLISERFWINACFDFGSPQMKN